MVKRPVVLLAVLVAGAFSQDWVARYSVDMADEARALVIDQGGNSYAAGYAGDYAAGGIVVIKYSPDGETLWTRTRSGTSSYDCGRMAAVLEPSGNVFVAAYVRQAPQNGFRLLRYTPGGVRTLDTVYWHSRSGLEPSMTTPVSMLVDNQGRIFVSGTTRNDSTLSDIVTCRLDASGRAVWARYVDGQRHDADRSSSLAFDQSQNILVAGDLKDASQHKNAVVLKYDTLGNLLWSYSHRQNTNFTSRAYSLAVGANGAVFATGTQQETGQPGQCLLLKLASSGDSVWSRTDSTDGLTVFVDSAGSAYVVGGYQGNLSVRSIRTWKYSQSGQLLWRRDYSVVDSTNSVPHFGLLAPDQGVFAVGKRQGSRGRLDYTVERYSPNGSRMWFAHTDTSDFYTDYPYAGCLDPWGNLVITGRTEDAISADRDFLTVRFRASGAVEEPEAPAAWRDVIRVWPSVAARGCRLQVPDGGGCGGLRVVDVTGRAVRSFGPVAGGRDISWDLRDDAGAAVANGVYLVVADGPDSPAPARIIVQR